LHYYADGNSGQGLGPSSGRGRGKVWQGDPVAGTAGGGGRSGRGTLLQGPFGFGYAVRKRNRTRSRSYYHSD